MLAIRRVKRAEMVEQLIGNPDYVEHWSNKWSDLLQVNSKFLGKEGADAFREWIRKQIDDNVPYDQFARSILTASGSNKDNPPASYVLQDSARPSADDGEYDASCSWPFASIATSAMTIPLNVGRKINTTTMTSYFAQVGSQARSSQRRSQHRRQRRRRCSTAL